MLTGQNAAQLRAHGIRGNPLWNEIFHAKPDSTSNTSRMGLDSGPDACESWQIRALAYVSTEPLRCSPVAERRSPNVA